MNKTLVFLGLFLAGVISLSIYSLREQVGIYRIDPGEGGGTGVTVSTPTKETDSNSKYCSRKKEQNCDSLARRCIPDKNGGHCGAPDITKSPKKDKLGGSKVASPLSLSCSYTSKDGTVSSIQNGKCLEYIDNYKNYMMICKKHDGTTKIVDSETGRSFFNESSAFIPNKIYERCGFVLPCCNNGTIQYRSNLD